MKHLNACPLCQHQEIHPYLSAKDYTVSHETFSLTQCVNCGFVFTNPQPDDDKLGAYYKSEAYVSHSNKSRTLFDRVYRIARSFSLRWKYNLITQYSSQPPATLLDYGCGTGSFLRQCASKGLIINGVEPDPKARDIASEETRISISPDIQSITGTYDVITLWHVLEHVSDLHVTLSQLRQRLAQNGTMFIAVPNLNSADANKYREHWAAYDVPRHLWHFSQKTMTQVLNAHKIEVKYILPMRLDAYYVSMLSEKYQRGHQSISTIARAIASGLMSNQKAQQTGEYSSLIYIARK